jgi:hypothetical protein
MVWSPELASAFVLGAALASLVLIAFSQFSANDTGPEEPIPGPLPKKEYLEKLEASKQGYLDAMSKYDRLVPWAAGGALVVSLSFVSAFAASAPAWSKWILSAAWLSLVASLMCSIYSQYSSTRIKVAAQDFLTAVQTPPKKRANPKQFEEWQHRARTFQRKARHRARNTRLLNEFGGIMLLFGLICLGAFAIIAVPFTGS